MERLIINIPEKKSNLIKQILKELGATIQQEKKFDPLTYRKKISKVNIWSEKDTKEIEEGGKILNNLKPQEW